MPSSSGSRFVCGKKILNSQPELRLLSRAMKMLSAVLLFGLLTAPLALEGQEPIITAESAILFDANTGRVIYKKNENERRAVASTRSSSPR